MSKCTSMCWKFIDSDYVDVCTGGCEYTEIEMEIIAESKTKKEETYLPLGHGLIIERSEIHGHGLFASKDIPSGTNLGISHILIDDDGELVRTPLGGFYNHSETPNCAKKQINNTRNTISWSLISLRDIKAGEEITVNYTFYKIE